MLVVDSTHRQTNHTLIAIFRSLGGRGMGKQSSNSLIRHQSKKIVFPYSFLTERWGPELITVSADMWSARR